MFIDINANFILESELKVHLTPIYSFRLKNSLHQFETHGTVLPPFNSNLDYLQAVKFTISVHHLSHTEQVRGMGLLLG